MLEVDGAAVRRESLRVRDDERRAVGRPRYVEPLVHELEELLHEGCDGRRGVDFHRWRDSRLVFNRCCLGGAASPLAVCRYRWSGVAAPIAYGPGALLNGPDCAMFHRCGRAQMRLSELPIAPE